jgi:hypothetical protein
MRSRYIALVVFAAVSPLAGCGPAAMGDPPAPYTAQPVPPPPPAPPAGHHHGRPPGVGMTVEAFGCPVKAVESECLTLRDQHGRVWNITGATPAPDPAQGRAIQITGKVSDTSSVCREGVVLARATWRYTSVRCGED